MRWIAILGVLTLGGCGIYPIYKTLQPQLEIVVVNDEKEPVQGAQVALISSSYPYAWERSREIQTTDGKGVAKFQRRSEWRVEVIMLHGAETYFWNWCAEKEGFVTYKTQNRSGGIPRSRILIELERGESKECPEIWY